MGKQVSDDDHQRAQALFAIGRTLREISDALGRRVSPSWISRHSREENWQRGILPESHVTPDNPQIYESANATAEEMSTNTDKLQEGNRRRWIEHKGELADEFGEKIRLLLDRAFSPCTLKEQKLVGQGGGEQRVTLVETELELPPPADQVKLITGVAILVDKASLLVGDATSRVETASLSKEQAQERLGFLRSEFEERLERRRAEAEKKTGEQTG